MCIYKFQNIFTILLSDLFLPVSGFLDSLSDNSFNIVGCIKTDKTCISIMSLMLKQVEILFCYMNIHRASHQLKYHFSSTKKVQ